MGVVNPVYVARNPYVNNGYGAARGGMVQSAVPNTVAYFPNNTIYPVPAYAYPFQGTNAAMGHVGSYGNSSSTMYPRPSAPPGPPFSYSVAQPALSQSGVSPWVSPAYPAAAPMTTASAQRQYPEPSPSSPPKSPNRMASSIAGNGPISSRLTVESPYQRFAYVPPRRETAPQAILPQQTAAPEESLPKASTEMKKTDKALPQSVEVLDGPAKPLSLEELLNSQEPDPLLNPDSPTPSLQKKSTTSALSREGLPLKEQSALPDALGSEADSTILEGAHQGEKPAEFLQTTPPQAIMPPQSATSLAPQTTAMQTVEIPKTAAALGTTGAAIALPMDPATLTYPERIGKKAGQAVEHYVAGWLNQNPQLEEKLRNSNIEHYLDDPAKLLDEFKANVNNSKLVTYGLKHIKGPLVNVFPVQWQDEATAVMDWLLSADKNAPNPLLMLGKPGSQAVPPLEAAISA